MTTIARYYDEDKNPPQRYDVDADGTPTIPVYASLPGVPLRDLTEDEWEQLPEHLQQSVDASDFYRKTKPPGRSSTAHSTRPAANPAPAAAAEKSDKATEKTDTK